MDKWQKMEYQYILLTLMEIVYTFDLGDEIGRDNLKILLETLLKNFDIEEQTIKVIVQCTENLITKQEDRLQVSGLNLSVKSKLLQWRCGS